MRTLSFKIAASVAVRVDVNGGVLFEFVGVVLRPFCRSQQHGLFAIPRAINNGALGFPSLLEQFAQSAGFFQQRDLAGDWIFRAVDPSVMMVAANHPLAGLFRTRN